MDSMGGNPCLDFQESVDGLVQLDQNQSTCFKYVGCLLCNVEEYLFIGKMMVPLGWYPSCLTPKKPLKRGISSKYPLYKVYMGLTIKGTIPRVPPFSL